VSEKTIEENILRKARQRRHLDFLAITAGNFTPEQMYNQRSLTEMLLGDEREGEGGKEGAVVTAPAAGVSAKEVQAAMAAMEDEADVAAMRDAEMEGAEEMNEFDDSKRGGGGGGGVGGGGDEDPTGGGAGEGPGEEAEEGGEGDDNKSTATRVSKKSKGEEGGREGEGEEGAMGEEEFAAFQNRLGPDVGAIEARLRPVERYAFRFRTEIDPYYSLFYVSEEQRRRELEEDAAATAVDVEVLEAAAAAEEAKSLEEGEVLATSMDMEPEAIQQQEWGYRKERGRRRAEARRRAMTGDDWVREVEALSGT